MKNHRRRKKNTNKNAPVLKKKIIIGLVALACAVPVLYFAQLAIGYFENSLKNTSDINVPSRKIQFYQPDYDADIMQDEDYLDKVRYIEYTEGNISTLITADNHQMFGVAAVFFRDYFEAIINGDSEIYNTFFTEDYYNDNEPLESFTKQRVYNISVSKESSVLIESGKHAGSFQYIYKVLYMIMKNDGTFRNDMGSDVALPLAFELIYDGYTVKINSISRYINVYI